MLAGSNNQFQNYESWIFTNNLIIRLFLTILFLLSSLMKQWSVMLEPGGPLPYKYLADKLTLFQPGEGKLSPPITTGIPIFFTFRHHWMLDKIHILLTGSETNSETTNLIILLLQFVGWIKGWKPIWVASQNFQSGSGLKIICGFGPFEGRKWTRSHLIFIYVFQRVPIQATFCQSNLSR